MLRASGAAKSKSTALIDAPAAPRPGLHIDTKWKFRDMITFRDATAARLGLDGIHTLAADAAALTALRPEWAGRFDRILVDAPCSGLGTLARHADARWRLSPDQIEELVELQQNLLAGVLPLLAPAGRLVYATCTVHPRENGGTIAALLARTPQLRQRCQRTWWPGEGEQPGDGFYAAVLEFDPINGLAAD